MFSLIIILLLPCFCKLFNVKLCAREYGKPAVSNINIHTELKNGMKVSVDGNTGIVKILNSDNDDE